MTDREALIQMLDRAGIVWRDADSSDSTEPGSITVEAHAGPNNLGYEGFVLVYEFTADGALKTVGAWE